MSPFIRYKKIACAVKDQILLAKAAPMRRWFALRPE